MTFKDYLSPLNEDDFGQVSGSLNTYQQQVKKHITSFPELDDIDIVLIGINELRDRKNQHIAPGITYSADAMRRQFYKLFKGNYEVKIADLGNLEAANSFNDTAYAFQETVRQLLELKKTIIVFGSQQELIPAHYKGFETTTKALNLAVLDAYLDLSEVENEEGYLTQIIKHTPEFLFNISHIGNQMYLNEPGAAKLMDAMLFDVSRLGLVRNNLADTEPIFRNADLVCVNVPCIKQADFPAQLKGSANGLLSEEICALMRYAGIGNNVRSVGIYDYISDLDTGEQSSKLAAQMLWHFVDGYYSRVEENPLQNENDFIRYRVALHANNTNEMVFYKSTVTERWYMEVTSNFHKNSFILPCSYSDYNMATAGDIPDRWMKATQKLM
jgi:arginase family enzyme